VGSLPFLTKPVAMATSLEISDRSSAPKTLLFVDNIAKIGPTDLEIIVLQEIIKNKKKN